MPEVEENERLARYAIEKSYFRSDGTVRHNAFMPAADGSTSVFCVSGMEDAEICALGAGEVAVKRAKPLLGRVEIIARHVFNHGLHVQPDEPPARHANIVRWPAEPSERKELALKLAALAAFFPCN